MKRIVLFRTMNNTAKTFENAPVKELLEIFLQHTDRIKLLYVADGTVLPVCSTN